MLLLPTCQVLLVSSDHRCNKRGSMHPILSHSFHSCQAELSAVDSATAQLHPEGRPNFPSIQQRVQRNVAILRQHSELLRKRLERGRLPRDNRRTRLEWFLQLMVLGTGYIPEGSPMVDEEILQPCALAQSSGRELAKQLALEIEVFDGLLDECRKRFGMERIEIHPLLGPLRVDQWRRCEVLQLRTLRREVKALRRLMARPLVQPLQQAARA